MGNAKLFPRGPGTKSRWINKNSRLGRIVVRFLLDVRGGFRGRVLSRQVLIPRSPGSFLAAMRTLGV